MQKICKNKRNLPKMIGEKVICYNEKSNTIQDFEDKLDNIIIMLSTRLEDWYLFEK